MRNIKVVFISMFWILMSITLLAQEEAELTIMQLEELERTAILEGDTLSLANIMSERLMVNNPENRLVDYHEVMKRLRTGKIDYTRFDRKIDKISVFGNTAIVMGSETIEPKSTSDNAGKTITRRFTNVWQQGPDGWKLIARQATIISIEETLK